MNTQKRNLKISFAKTPEQVALVKKMGSKNKLESLAASEALASVLTRPILQVIEQAPVISNLYTTLTYDAGTPPVIPLDPYFDVRARNFLTIWTQNQPGGTAQNFTQGQSDLYVQVYPLYGEVSMNKNWLRAGNIDYLAANMTRIVQEVLLIQETNGAFVLFNSVPNARIDGNNSNTATTNIAMARSATAGVFQLDDFNTIMIGYDRTTASWVGGTPVNERRSITDLLGSPEWMGQIRSIAYQPQNTRQGSYASSGGSSIAAPENVREEIFKAGGIPTLYDVNLHKVYEMGVGRNYNTVFSTAIGTLALPGNGTGFGGGTTSTFNSASEQIVVGLNSEMFDLARLRMTEENSEFSLVNDDTFSVRSDKLGFVGGLTEGYVSVDGRAKFSLIY
jgi:hypothetical protein